MFSTVVLPTGELQYRTSSFLWVEHCWHFSWSLKKSLQVGIQVFKGAFKGFHRAALWIRNLKHFTVGFFRVICQTTLMIFGYKGAAKLIVTSPQVYSEEPTCLRWAFSDFHDPFYQNKRLCKTMQCGGIETDPRSPTRRVQLPCFVKLLQLFARDRIFMNRRPKFPFCISCLQTALMTLLDFWKAESPTIDHGLLFGGCLKYRSMAARIASRDKTLLWTQCRLLAWQQRYSFNSSFSISCITVLNFVWLANHSIIKKVTIHWKDLPNLFWIYKKSSSFCLVIKKKTKKNKTYH